MHTCLETIKKTVEQRIYGATSLVFELLLNFAFESNSNNISDLRHALRMKIVLYSVLLEDFKFIYYNFIIYYLKNILKKKTTKIYQVTQNRQHNNKI